MQSGTDCPLLSKVSTRIVIFHLTMVMYIHVYNTVSFSADTVINTTCKPIVESKPGQKSNIFNLSIWRTVPGFLHVLILHILYITTVKQTIHLRLISCLEAAVEVSVFKWKCTFSDILSAITNYSKFVFHLNTDRFGELSNLQPSNYIIHP